MKKILTLLILLGLTNMYGQYKRPYKNRHGSGLLGDDLSDSWAWSVNSSYFSLSDIKKSSTSLGIDAEWFMSDRWSLRGGISLGTDYLKFTTEPFVLYLLAGSSSDDHRHHHSHSHYSSRNSGAAAKLLLLMILDSDALCYNIPINKRMMFSVFGSPLQTVVTFSDSKTHAYSLVGAGLKYVGPGGLVLNACAEYDNAALWKQNGSGYRVNFGLGYLFR